MSSTQQRCLLLGGAITGSALVCWILRGRRARKTRECRGDVGQSLRDHIVYSPDPPKMHWPGDAHLLVTGGAGFVLANLIYHWLEVVPGATAVIFDKPHAWDEAVKQFLSEFLRRGQVQFFAGSVDSVTSWEELVREHGTMFTHVVAGAALTPTEDEERRLSTVLIDVNFTGFVNCIEFARLKCKRLKRFIHISSDAVLGVPGLVNRLGTESLASDSDDLPEMSLYALSKVGGEAIVARWRTLYDMDAVSVRFSDVYGRMDRDTGARNRHNAPYWVCRQVRETLISCAPGKVSILGCSVDDYGWDYIDAPSVARGLVALLRSVNRPKKRTYHLALGRCVSHRELLNACGLTSDSAEIVPVERLDPATTGRIHVVSLGADHWLRKSPVDVKSMADEFGFVASPVKQAVKEYMEWLCAHDY